MRSGQSEFQRSSRNHMGASSNLPAPAVRLMTWQRRAVLHSLRGVLAMMDVCASLKHLSASEATCLCRALQEGSVFKRLVRDICKKRTGRIAFVPFSLFIQRGQCCFCMPRPVLHCEYGTHGSGFVVSPSPLRSLPLDGVSLLLSSIPRSRVI